MTPVPLWIEAVVALLVAMSGLIILLSAVGFLALPDFFLRMHPPALAYTGGAWSVALAGAVYFAFVDAPAALFPGAIVAMLLITMPVTTVMLARAALFRRRASGAPDTPPPLSAAAAADAAPDAGVVVRPKDAGTA